jgi:RNA polymerase sigma factor (sigma-70 family)
MRAKEFILKEFAPSNSGGESGRWYTDDQMTDLVGDGWWQDMDVSGANIGVIDSEVPKEYMIQQAQAWLDDQGYSVQVLNCRVNDDDMDWFIEGSFQNSSFAKKGVAEGFDSENNPWHVTDVDAVSETDFEVALQGPAGIKLNFVIRPVDFVETQRERYQIDSMDVRDLQSGKTMHWGSMQNLGKWEPIFDAIDEHFWMDRSLQAHLAKIIDYYMDAGEHGKNPDMMSDLDKRDPNGIAVSAKDFVASHNQADAAIKSAKKGVAEGRGSGYKEIEFVCANPEFPDATDPELQKQLYANLKQIPGVIPLFQDQSDYSEGQYSLTAIYKDRAVRGQILKLAKQLGVSVDLEQPVTDDYVNRAIRSEHEGQQGVAESTESKITVKPSLGKGNGLFATNLIKAGEVITSSKFEPISDKDWQLIKDTTPVKLYGFKLGDKHALQSGPFKFKFNDQKEKALWDKTEFKGLSLSGFMFINGADSPDEVNSKENFSGNTAEMIATKDIQPGKEIIKQYNVPTKGVAEVVNPDITTGEKYFSGPTPNVRIGDFIFNASLDSGGYRDPNAKGLKITAYDPKNFRKIGWIDFIVHKDKKGNTWLESDETEVDDRYRRKGVATMMYAYAKSLGNDIKPSDLQSDQGIKMWKKWGSDAAHLVGEQGVAEGDGNPNQQIALYNPDGRTYRGSYNKMPTLDPNDPGHQSSGYRVDPNQSYETDFDKEDLKRVVARGMSGLSDSDKHILELRFWDDLTYNEIAAKLGIPSEQVKSLEALALRKLKRPKISDTLRPYSWLQGMAEATGDERFDSMMGRLASGAAARQDVDRLSTSLTARTGSNPESALAKWGQEFIKWLEDICRNIARQGVDKFSKFEKLGNFDDGGETMAHWLIEVAKKSNTSGITLADIQEFSGEFNSHGMWAWQQFPLAWSQSEWQDYKDQWTGPDGYIANLGQGVKEEQTNHWYDSGVKDARRDANLYPDRVVKKLNPRTRLKTMQDKQARHPDEVEQYSLGYKGVKQGVAEGLNEFAMDDGNNGEDPTDNYPCYDCGSTIFLHHTKLCDLAEPNAKHDLPARPGSQHWTGEIPKGLHPIPGLQEDVAENFIDGQHPEDKGDSKRHGINTKASVSSLRKTAKHSSGRKQKLAHWLANMKAGQAKANKK